MNKHGLISHVYLVFLLTYLKTVMRMKLMFYTGISLCIRHTGYGCLLAQQFTSARRDVIDSSGNVSAARPYGQ